MKNFAIILLASAFLVACAGRDPSPVEARQSNDRSLSCSQLASAIQSNDRRVAQLEMEKSDRNSRNVKLGIATAFLLLPVFWLDISNGVEVDLGAQYDRGHHLQTLSDRKNC